MELANREAAHIAPVELNSGADAMAHALTVRERRRSLFFRAEPPRIAEVQRPVKAKTVGVVPPIETTLAEKFLGEIAEFHSLGCLPSLGDIKVAVCNFYRVRAIDLLSSRRTKDVVIPRQVAMWFARRATLQSFPSIGRYFGRRDHSTAVHAVNRVTQRIAACEDVKQHVASIADDLRRKGFTVDVGMTASY